MRDIRWRAFWLGLGLIFICLIIWAASDAFNALIFFTLGIILYLASHLYWLNKLQKWLVKRNLNAIPNGSGVWEDIFASLYQEQRRHDRSQTQLSSALDRFQLAANALPDGVVLLTEEDRIEWCNPTAAKQLGLKPLEDIGQPISYLVRHGDFIQYLRNNDYSVPIKLKSWRSPDITLEIQLVPFSTKRKLLISRDVTQLEKVENMRRDFIANVSHELRTPLTVVGGFLETLADMEGAIPENIRGYFGMMQDQTSRMRRLVEDLLTLSQLENKDAVLQDAEVDVPALLNMVLHEAQSLSQGRHHITLEADPGLNLNGAMEELHSAFGNLVGNAIRYTPDGGEISMKWERRDSTAVFSVHDTGIGIEQKHIDRLTERFYRVDRSRSRETGGTGLGLSIVKHILTRHQAKLEIESALGKGSTFRVVFPKERLIHKQAALFA